VAVGMDIYAPFLVPDTFQTSAYRAAKDRIFYPARSADEHELAARLLRERASRLIGKHGPHMRIVVEERALRTPEARSDPSGEHDQYAQLRLIIDGLKRLNTARQELPPGSELNPNITIQVEPLTSGTHPLCRCAHTLLHMSNRPHAAVYVQNPAGRYETFYPNPAEHTIEQQTFSRLLDMLPGPEKTDEILDNILASFPS